MGTQSPATRKAGGAGRWEGGARAAVVGERLAGAGRTEPAERSRLQCPGGLRLQHGKGAHREAGVCGAGRRPYGVRHTAGAVHLSAKDPRQCQAQAAAPRLE